MALVITKLVMAKFCLQLKDLQLPIATWPAKVGWGIKMPHNKLNESCTVCHVEMGQVVLEPKYVLWIKVVNKITIVNSVIQ